MKKHLKKLLFVSALLTLGTTSFAALTEMRPGDSNNDKSTQWSGSADIDLRVNGRILDLNNKYGLMVIPVKSGVGDVLAVEFGTLAKGQESEYVSSAFKAMVVKNDVSGNLLKYKITNPSAITSVFTTTLGGTTTNTDQIITDEGKLMTSLVKVNDGEGTLHEIGKIQSRLDAGLTGDLYDYNGIVQSKMSVHRDAIAGSFASDIGRVRVTVANLTIDPATNIGVPAQEEYTPGTGA